MVAQDITAFGADRGEAQLAPMLDALNAVDGIEWIRLLYAYPERITDDVIAAMTRNKKVLHYLDVPIQHIDPVLLRAMNRKGGRDAVLHALNRLRAAMPDITLRTTLIAGYPGETEEQFEALCNFVRESRFERLGCFAYSEEEGTPAALEQQLPMEVREQRAETVMRIQTEIMAEKQAAKIGKTVRALCDGWDEESGLYLCRTAADAPEIDAVCCVRSEAPIGPGTFLDVRIEESDVYDLYGAPSAGLAAFAKKRPRQRPLFARRVAGQAGAPCLRRAGGCPYGCAATRAALPIPFLTDAENAAKELLR